MASGFFLSFLPTLLFSRKKMPKIQEFFDGIAETDPFTRTRGGCLYFAYVFWKWLRLNNMPTESFQIIQYDNDNGDTINHNLKWIDGETDHPESSHHYTWMYEGVEYDGNGPYDVELHGISFHERITLDGLNTPFVNLVDQFCIEGLNKAGWNFMFSRMAATEIIERNLGITMEEIEHTH